MTKRHRSLFVLLLVLGLIAASLAVLNQRETKLGLDLQGGVQLVYEAEPTAQQPTVTPEALQRALDLMRQRVDAFGVAEPELARIGSNLIEVSLPGVKNAERAVAQVGSTAQLFFYDWEANLLDENCKTEPTQVDGGTTPVTGLYQAVKQASKCKPQKPGPESQTPLYYAFDKVSKRPFNNGQPSTSEQDASADLTPAQKARAEVVQVPTGVRVVRASKPDAKSAPPDSWWVMQDRPALSGTDIKNPEQNFDQQAGNQPIVTFDFTGKGRKAFHDITRRIAERGADNAPPGASADNASQHFGIELDNDVVSAPFINYRENPDGIDGSTGAQISGGFTIQSAQDLAKTLKIGALPIKLEPVSRSQVSATLGKQALHQGLIAGIAGFGLVVGFLILYYRLLGVIAAGALAIYALYFYALVKIIPVTLTLPGIAGLILTLGVAADANIVIFERVKEEARAGRSIPAAISSGYAKALRTIIDANVVTLGVAFILFMLATAGVKGFAFTLLIGTLVSLFTAVLATQAILGSMARTKLMRSRMALRVTQGERVHRFDFMGNSKWFFSMSGLILVAGALAIAGLGIKFGIDFDSGTRITTPVTRAASVEQVRSVLSPLGYGDAKIQQVSDPELGSNVIQISTRTLEPSKVTEGENALDKSFGVQRSDFSSSSVGPTFGQEIARTAIIAIIASLVLISIYIGLRFEFKFAVPVLIALMHDLLITSGVYALFQREVTTSTVAALLTILGFSLYDTIIVFDRIRENVPRMPRATFSQIVNRSMSEVITRSLVTSLSTLLPILALMLFGGETLQDFGFALLIGVASGTYSSIFIAAPVLVHWKERETVWKRRERLVLEDHGGVIPAYAEGYLGEKETVVAERVPRRRRKERTQPVAEPVAQATAVEEPPAEPEPEPQPEPAPARPVAQVGRPRTPEERRAARRAARAAAQAGDGERSSAEPPSGDGIHEQKQKPKRPSGKKKHGRSR